MSMKVTRTGNCVAFAEQQPQANPAWPPAIEHRAPKAIDGDKNGKVQVLTNEGWEVTPWDCVPPDRGWQHTPLWTLRDRWEVLIDQLVLLIGSRQPITPELQELVCEMRGALGVEDVRPATNRHQAEQLNTLDRMLLRAREAMAASNKDTALLAFRLAREELEALIQRLVVR